MPTRCLWLEAKQNSSSIFVTLKNVYVWSKAVVVLSGYTRDASFPLLCLAWLSWLSLPHSISYAYFLFLRFTPKGVSFFSWALSALLSLPCTVPCHAFVSICFCGLAFAALNLSGPALFLHLAIFFLLCNLCSSCVMSFNFFFGAPWLSFGLPFCGFGAFFASANVNVRPVLATGEHAGLVATVPLCTSFQS